MLFDMVAIETVQVALMKAPMKTWGKSEGRTVLTEDVNEFESGSDGD